MLLKGEAWAGVAGVFLVGILSQGTAEPFPANAPDTKETANGEGNFVVLGDWGNPFHPGEDEGNKDCWGPHWKCNGCGKTREAQWCDVGTPGYELDEYSQTNISSQMTIWAKDNKAQFLLNVGDSFYPGGVESADHDMWTYVFEARYSDEVLKVPWFSVLGNHDYGGFQCFFDSSKMVFSHAQAQFDYDTEKNWEWPKSKARRWIMPSHFYKKRVVFGNVTIDLFMVDTNYVDDKDGPLACGQGEIRIPPACEGDDFTNCKAYCTKLGADQAAFLLAEVPKSDATWKFLIGHHPLEYLLPSLDNMGKFPKGSTTFFLENNISAYFCGHVHGMAQAWYVSAYPGGSFTRTESPKAVPGALFQMQNGAGGGSYPDNSFNGARWGFTGVKVKATSIEVTYFSEQKDPALLVLQPPCVQNWPGSASCKWGAGTWNDCTDGSQSREVWCLGGAEENCQKAAKPEATQSCGGPSPSPSPGPSPSPSGQSQSNKVIVIAAVGVGVIVIGIVAAAFVLQRRRRARTIGGTGGPADPLAGRELPSSY